MKVIDIMNPPGLICIGRKGENVFREVPMDVSGFIKDHLNGTITAMYQSGENEPFPVVLEQDGTVFTWKPRAEEITDENGRIEVVLTDGEVVGATKIIECFVDESLIDGTEHPAESAPAWSVEMIQKVESAVSHYPKIVNGVWYVWSVQDEDYVSTGIEAQGEDGYSPTVTVTEIEGGHRVTITDVDGAHTFDVMDGEDGEGGGSAANAVLYTAQSLTDAQKTQARTNVGAGTYSKPSGGIPKTDLASAVQASLGKADTALQTAPVQSVNGQTGAVTIPIPTVPQMATQTDMSDWTSGKTVDASAVKTVVSDKQNAPLEIPVTESGGTYSTTVTAEQIRAAKENSVFVLGGEARIKALLWLPWDEGVELLIGFQILNSTIITVGASVSNNSVSIGVEQTPIPTAVSELTNDSGYQTASDVQTAINGVRQLPAVTATDNGKFLRVVSGAWAAETVQTYQGGSY